MNETNKLHVMKKQINVLLFLICLFSFNIIFGQDISFKADAPRVVRPGEQFQIQFTVNQDVDEFTPPDFGEFRYLGGPSTGSSTSVQFVNGKTTKSASYSFSYYIQAPASIGKYKLGPATAIYKKNQVKSNSLEIEVVGQSSATTSTSSPSANTSRNTQNQTQVASGDDVFIRLETDKKSAYIGEQISVWVKIYSKVGISRIDDQFKGPNFVSFYKQDVAIPQLSSLDREKVGNDIYYTGILRKVILYPQKSGDVTIEPFDILVEIQKQTKRQSRSIFDDFFGGGYERSRVNLKSKPVKFHIKPLPGNQPADFSGAVGKFDFNTVVNKTEAKTNDAITFKARISGRGNIKLLEELKTNFPPDFDVFEPVIKTTIDDGTYGATGSKLFEYTIIPRHAGKYEIAPFRFTYFDLVSGTYKTLSSPPFQLNIAKGDVDSNTVVVSNISKEDVKMLGVDIRYIETATVIRLKGQYFFGSLWFYLFYIVLTLAFILILIIRWDRIRKSRDVARARNKKAGKVAAKRLIKAKKALKTGDKELFYDEIGQTLWGYLSEKLNIPVSELTKESAVAEFKVHEVDDNLVETFFNLVESCEFARFAPGSKDSSDMQKIIDEAQAIIESIEDNIRR